jgi:hypothetical protein
MHEVKARPYFLQNVNDLETEKLSVLSGRSCVTMSINVIEVVEILERNPWLSEAYKNIKGRTGE